jgi:tRNA-guanine family transglycosylase
MPAKIMVDSGAFAPIANPGRRPSQYQIFCQQINISKGSTVPTNLCHLDVPLPPGDIDILEVYRRIERTVANAYEFLHLFKTAGLPPNFKSLGVIQGNSFETISFCANELARAGFDYLGIGSLAMLYNNELILERVRTAARVAGPGLHVFGISGIEVAAQLMAMGIRSIDSSRPMKAAMYNCLLYSSPFRRFKLINSKIKDNIAILDRPLPCDCPICKKDPALIFRAGEKRYHNMRAVHNYYHLRRELMGISNKY